MAVVAVVKVGQVVAAVASVAASAARPWAAVEVAVVVVAVPAPRVLSDAAAVAVVDASPRSSAGKNLKRCRHRRSVACASARAMARVFVCVAVRR